MNVLWGVQRFARKSKESRHHGGSIFAKNHHQRPGALATEPEEFAAMRVTGGSGQRHVQLEDAAFAQVEKFPGTSRVQTLGEHLAIPSCPMKITLRTVVFCLVSVDRRAKRRIRQPATQAIAGFGCEPSLSERFAGRVRARCGRWSSAASSSGLLPFRAGGHGAPCYRPFRPDD